MDAIRGVRRMNGDGLFRGRRVLVHVFERIWPVNSGFAVRIWQQLDTLQALGAEVHVLAMDTAFAAGRARWPAEATRYLEDRGLRVHLHKTHPGTPDFWWMAAWQVVCKKLGGIVWPPARSKYYWRPGLQRFWRRLLRQHSIDACLISYAYWHRLARVAAEEGVWSVLEMHELLAHQLSARARLAGKRVPSDAETAAFQRDEMACLASADCVVAINETEAGIVRNSQARPVVYLPMCLPERKLPAHEAVPSDILVVGSFLEHNRRGLRQFLDGPWKRITAERPGTRLVVCGRVGEVVEPGEGIERHLDVPDLTPFYQGARVTLLVTVAGAGIKIKAIEALAHGCCIVAHQHSVAGIPFVNGTHGVVVGEMDAAATPILELLADDSRRARLAAGARDLFRRNFNLERSREVMAEIFRPVLQRPGWPARA